MRLSRTEAFAKAYRKLVRKNRDLDERIEKALRLMASDLRHPSLRVHPVRSWPGCWEASVTDSVRIIFALKPEEIVLLMVGEHDILP